MSIMKYRTPSFNWIGREGGIPFVNCIKCGKPVIFSLINNIYRVQFIDLCPGDDDVLSWFLPFVAIVHEDCGTWNRIPDNQKPCCISQQDEIEMWRMMREFWAIFNHPTDDHYELYYRNSSYGMDKPTRQGTMNMAKNLYRTQ